MPRHSLTILSLLLASTAPMLPQGVQASSRARAVADAQDEVVRYAVQPGDTLQALAAAHFVDPAAWKKAQDFNGLSDGAALVPGSILKLRQSWLKAAPIRAEIVAWRGDVSAESAAVRRPVSVGMKLGEGDRLETGANGFVTLMLPDNSLVTLPSNSRIRMDRLRAVSLTDSIDRRFLLEEGRSEAKVTPMTNPASKFMITTPVSVAAVRGTQFRVSYTPAEMKAREEVLEGKVAVGPRGEPSGRPGEVLLLPGFGAVASAQGVSGAIALLPAPVLEAPKKAQTAETVQFRLKSIPGAATYAVELATDAAFVDRFAEVESTSTDIRFANVPNGSLHVRIAARDRNGLTGLPTSYAFERRFSGGTATSESGKPGGKASGSSANPDKSASKESAQKADASEDSRLSLLSQLSRKAENAVEAAATAEAADGAIVEEGDSAWDSDTYVPMRLHGGQGFSGSAGEGYTDAGNAGGTPPWSSPGWSSPSGSGGGPLPPETPSPPVIGPDLPSPVAPSPVLPPAVLPPEIVPPVPVPPFGGESGEQAGLPALPVPPKEPGAPVAVVPEPASWALLISGFGLIGIALRRRRLRKA